MKKIFIILCVCVFVFVGCSKVSDKQSTDAQSDKKENTTDTTEATIEIGQAESDVFDIETPYCTLKYPSKWKDKILVNYSESDVYKVEFKAKNSGTPIFDIIFGNSEEYLLGILDVDGKSVDVSVKSYDIEDTEPNVKTYCEMQADINVIINRLNSEYDFELGS